MAENSLQETLALRLGSHIIPSTTILHPGMNTFPPPFPRTPTDQTSFGHPGPGHLNHPYVFGRGGYRSSSNSPTQRSSTPSSPLSSSKDSNSPDRPNHQQHQQQQPGNNSRYTSSAPSPIISVTTSSPTAPFPEYRRTSENSPTITSPGATSLRRERRNNSTGIVPGSPARVLGLGVGMASSPGGGSGSGSGSGAASPGSSAGGAGLGPGGVHGGVPDTPLDVETVLRHTGGDAMVGLQQVVEERNSLAQQNAQLWKLMAKYRGRMAEVVKERERFKTEQDEAITQLAKGGEQVDIGSPGQEDETSPAFRRSTIGRNRAGTVTATTMDAALVRPMVPPRSNSDMVAPRANAGAEQWQEAPRLESPPPIQDPSSRGRRISVTSLQSEPPIPVRGDSIAAVSVSPGSISAPTSPLDPTGSMPSLSRGNTMAPSPLSQEVSYMPSSSGSGMETARPGDSAALLPSPPIGAAPNINARMQSPDLAILHSRQMDTTGENSRLRKMSEIPRSPASSQASTDDRERQLFRGQSTSAANVLADQGLGIKMSRTSTNESADRTGSDREAGTASPDISSLYAYGSSTTVASQPSPQSDTRYHSPTKVSLTPQLLPYARCDVPSGRITHNSQGKDVMSFEVMITLRPPGTGRTIQWNSVKLFSAFLELDEEITRLAGGRRGAKQAGIIALPDGRARRDAAPSKGDQRRAALEAYLQTLLAAPLDDKSALCRFLTSDVADRGAAPAPTSAQGRKMGYLTKKGKNLGGWKTRFFVLDGLSLHYFEKRDGDHLGSIPLTAAQIGRQHKDPKTDDGNEKAYRHAFLILEEDRRKNANPPRHVLCAESDNDRDAWVQALVRAVRGDFADHSSTGLHAATPREPNAGRPSTEVPERRPHLTPTNAPELPGRRMPEIPVRQQSKDGGRASSPREIPIQARPVGVEAGRPSTEDQRDPRQSKESQRGPQHIPQFSASSMASAPMISSSVSAPVEGGGMSIAAEQEARPAAGRQYSGSGGVAGSPLVTPTKPARPQSMMPFKSNPALETLKSQSKGPALNTSLQVHRDIPDSPDREVNKIQRGLISGPTGGAPIPLGFRFGAARDSALDQQEKERKHKSMRIWGFGKQQGPAANLPTPKPVFGVTLLESMAVSEVANLPAVVFRCIKYLEAKHAESEEGIFRLSGSSTVIRGLKDRFDVEGDIDLIARDERWDLHAIAGLLKLFLRELATSLLTPEHHMDFIRVLDLAEPSDRVREFARLVAALPLANYSLLRALVSHLILIATNCDVNKMTLRNIGIVFSPTLGLPAGIIFDLVDHFQAIFDPDPEDDTESLASSTASGFAEQRFSSSTEMPDAHRDQADGEADSDTDTPRARRQDSGEVEHRNRYNRNSLIYAAESDPMLGSKGRQMPVSEVDPNQDRRSSVISEGEVVSEEDFLSESGEGSETVQQHEESRDGEERP